MDKPVENCSAYSDRPVMLDHHDSVRDHVQQKVCSEVEHLERRIETLRLNRAPHAEIMISAFQRMINRKKGFLETALLTDRPLW
ncbi:hypothetical protein QVZ43_06945 [Marinobacter sp. chi1]|uniref:Uncharacterized protein n=1 Tax=Marinobacter suaedae TaxID=3057675 RepID=A0ABT8VZN1_9GAMM|nr:hypothetical protein [Marinobacter sp. chi1]MDO3721456.1 hypothetical protein [Marinobacter sp. chi1]